MILDPELASIVTGVPTRTIQRWVLRGWIEDHGDGQHIRINAYDVAELATLRDSRKGHRLPLGYRVT